MIVFINSYIQHKNPTRAAREAGYKRPEQESLRLMKHPIVKSEIDLRLKDLGSCAR
jgi:phage terminase small subunit